MTVKQGGAAYSSSRKISRSRTDQHILCNLYLSNTRRNIKETQKLPQKIACVHKALGVRTLQTRQQAPFFLKRLEGHENLKKKISKNNTSNKEKNKEKIPERHTNSIQGKTKSGLTSLIFFRHGNQFCISSKEIGRIHRLTRGLYALRSFGG